MFGSLYVNLKKSPEDFDYLTLLKKQGKTKFGFIFNTDPHFKGGSHWFSLFVSVEPNNSYICYFDSVGPKQIPKNIQTLIDNILKHAKYNKINLPVYNNCGINHQKTDTECGMYSLYFVIYNINNNLNEVKSHFLNKNKLIPDINMKTLRNIYYSKHNYLNNSDN